MGNTPFCSVKQGGCCHHASSLSSSIPFTVVLCQFPGASGTQSSQSAIWPLSFEVLPKSLFSHFSLYQANIRFLSTISILLVLLGSLHSSFLFDLNSNDHNCVSRLTIWADLGISTSDGELCGGHQIRPAFRLGQPYVLWISRRFWGGCVMLILSRRENLISG